MRRAGALWLACFAVYAATIGLDAVGESSYGGDEPHYLLAAESLVEDLDLDVRDEYADRAYASFDRDKLAPQGVETGGRLHEPHGAGLPLLIAPAYALGGAVGAEVLLAALAALAVALAYLLALRAVPDPWAFWAAGGVGLSAPLLAYGTAIYPEAAAAAALTGAAVLALALDRRVTRRAAFGCFLALGALPWLGLQFVPAGIAIGAFAARALLRARRPTLAIGAVESAVFSVVLYVAMNEALFGGPTPYSANAAGESVTDASLPFGYVERIYRPVALLVDRDYGLLRWAPLFALVLVGLWLLYRSHRDHLVRAVPQLRSSERALSLCAIALAVQLLVAGLLAPTVLGAWFPARHLVVVLPLSVPLIALGLRRLPRLGMALTALTATASVWLYLDVRLGEGALAGPLPDAPFGPLTTLLPDFREPSSPYPIAAAIACALAILAVVLRERQSSNKPAAR